MTELLRTAIRQSLELLGSSTPTLDVAQVRVVGASDNTQERLLMTIARDLLQPLPWFRIDDRGIVSPQGSFFGFYALRGIVRGALLSVPFLRAGQLLLKDDLTSPAIAMFYTASFHALSSFLALTGRVVIEPVLGPPELHIGPTGSSLSFGALDKHPDVILAKHTKRNTWVFEPRSRGHGWRWRELSHVAREYGPLPQYFQRFMDYADSYGPDDMKSEIGVVLERISKFRHEALYNGLGADDFALDAALDHESHGGGIRRKAEAFGDFAISLLLDVTEQANELASSRSMTPATKKAIVGSVCRPFFDPPFVKDFGDEQVKNSVSALLSWLYGGLLAD